MRVLVTTTPGWGHVHPVVPLASALRDAGHEVTWATGPETAPRVEAYGFTSVAAGLSQAARREQLLARRPDLMSVPPRDRRVIFYTTMFAGISAPAMASDLIGVIDEAQPDLLVHEPCELATPALGAARGLPWVTVGFGTPIPERFLDAPEIHELWASVCAGTPRRAGLYEHAYLHPYPASLGPDPAAPTARHARPEAFDGGGDVPAWLAALGEDRPLVYVTYGTEFGAFAPYEAIFDAVAALDVDVLVTVGPTVDPSALPHPPANVRVEQYVPQQHVLRRAAAVVSHAGSGTVIGAAVNALPHVCLPAGADQFENAAAVVASGAGTALDPEDVSTTTVRAAIEQALGDDDLRRAAAALRAAFEAMPAVTEHVRHVEALAASR